MDAISIDDIHFLCDSIRAVPMDRGLIDDDEDLDDEEAASILEDMNALAEQIASVREFEYPEFPDSGHGDLR